MDTQLGMIEDNDSVVEGNTVSNKRYEEGTVLAFIRGHILCPSGCEMVIKAISPTRFYRINFYKSTKVDGCLLPHVQIVDSRFIEVKHTSNGLEIKG